MCPDSISAYNMLEKVARYDNDMEIMHPNRSKMIDIALEFIPFKHDKVFRVLELGAGTGFFTKKLLDLYPNTEIIAIDGAETMADIAKARLGSYTDQVDFKIGDFRNLESLVKLQKEGALVFSSFALHHLNKKVKQKVIAKAIEFLKPQGWFINADLIITESPEIEQRIQQIRIEGILHRAQGLDDRFLDFTSTRKFLDDLERKEGDQPITLPDDLQILENAGLARVTVLWQEYREVVYGGQKVK